MSLRTLKSKERIAQWKCRCKRCPKKKCCLRGVCTACAQKAVEEASMSVPKGPWWNPKWYPKKGR